MKAVRRELVCPMKAKKSSRMINVNKIVWKCVMRAVSVPVLMARQVAVRGSATVK